MTDFNQGDMYYLSKSDEYVFVTAESDDLYFLLVSTGQEQRAGEWVSLKYVEKNEPIRVWTFTRRDQSVEPLDHEFGADVPNLADFPKRAPWQAHEDEISDLMLKGGALLQVDDAAVDVPPRAELLREAETLIVGDRNKSYGQPTANFQNIADQWTVQFRHLLKDGVEFAPAHVAQAQILVKTCRMIAQPKRDNYLDIAGYAACGWEAEEDGMARKPVGIELPYYEAGMSWPEIDAKMGRANA